MRGMGLWMSARTLNTCWWDRPRLLHIWGCVQFLAPWTSRSSRSFGKKTSLLRGSLVWFNQKQKSHASQRMVQETWEGVSSCYSKETFSRFLMHCSLCSRPPLRSFRQERTTSLELDWSKAWMPGRRNWPRECIWLSNRGHFTFLHRVLSHRSECTGSPHVWEPGNLKLHQTFQRWPWPPWPQKNQTRSLFRYRYCTTTTKKES